MNKEFLDVIQLNKLYVQRYFYDSLAKNHPQCTGHIIGYKRTGDDNNWLKIRKTTLEIDAVTRDLLKNDFKIIFIQKTEYLDKCKNLIEILFTFAKVKRANGNKYEEWFQFKKPIYVSNIIMSLIIMMNNNNNINVPQNVKQYNYTDSESKIISNHVKDDSDDDDFFNGLAVGAGGLLAVGLFVGLGALISDAFMKENNNMPSSIKQGISVEILELILLEQNESPMYYYTSGKIHILLTDRRFIKIENYCVCSSAYLNDIKFVNHIKNSIFSFDKVEIIENNGRVETFGIYEKEVCAYFTNLLNSIVREIKNKKIEVPKKLMIESPKIELPKKLMIETPKIEVIKENICSRCLDKYEKSTKTNMCMLCIATLKVNS